MGGGAWASVDILFGGGVVSVCWVGSVGGQTSNGKGGRLGTLDGTAVCCVSQSALMQNQEITVITIDRPSMDSGTTGRKHRPPTETHTMQLMLCSSG